MVRAKFKCESVCFYEDSGEVVLKPVYDSDPESENGKFYKYTPAGEINLSIVSKETVDMFEAGKEYYIDFKEV